MGNFPTGGRDSSPFRMGGRVELSRGIGEGLGKKQETNMGGAGGVIGRGKKGGGGGVQYS